MARSLPAVLSAVVTSALMLTGCGEQAEQHATSVHAGDEYVAIGDSYTAAPATGPTVADDGCLQSSTNYPHLVAKRLRLDLTDASCSGATTQAVTQPQNHVGSKSPPQATALSPATDLVTISLGGNDFNAFGSVFLFCGSVRAQDPTGAPCTAAVRQGNGTHQFTSRFTAIEGRLAAVIRDVKVRAPNARVIVVGYPQFFPTQGPCEELPLAAHDYPLARRVNVLLVRAQQRAAARTNVDYVDVFTPTRGHDMCAVDPWIAGLRPARPDAAAYHPYPEEQRFVAGLLIKLIS